MTRLEARRVAQARARQRLRHGAVAALLVAPVVLVVLALVPTSAPPERPGGAPGDGHAAVGAAPAGGGWPAEGPGTWQYAAGGEVLGTAAETLRFRVAVEDDLPVSPEEFAEQVDGILGAERGWTAGGEHAFERVGREGQFDFTIFLASPGTAAQMCAVGGVHTGEEASCRLRSQVIVNVARWLAGAAGYAAPVADYRAYALNHVVGRELGYGPEACPRPGQPAPVMVPQAMGLQGCTPNGWPYRGVSRHAGPAIP